MFRYIVQTVSAGLVAKGYKKGYPFKNEWVSFCAFYKFLLLALDIIPIFLFLAIFLDVFLDIHEERGTLAGRKRLRQDGKYGRIIMYNFM